MSIHPNFVEDAADNSITFAGVLRSLLSRDKATGKKNGISKRWNDDTTKRYIQYYNAVILPKLPAEKPMHEYDADDYEEALQQIYDDYLFEKGVPYSQSMMDTFRRLIYYVHIEALGMHYTENDLWGTLFREQTAEETEESDAKLRLIKKSFSIDEELLVMRYLTKNASEYKGEELGLAIMFYTGVRNNESAAFTFECLRPLSDYPETYTLIVMSSTKRHSNERKAGGKTRNANRRIPIVENLREILLNRKAFLQNEIESGRLVLPEGKTIEDLPIACRGNNYQEFCSSDDLTREGRRMMKEAGVSEKHIVDLNRLLVRKDRADIELEEKQPATYLLRRNAATHYYNLGLTMPQIQFIMGHEIDDELEPRNSFSNDEKLQKIKQLVDRHPLCQIWDDVKKDLSLFQMSHQSVQVKTKTPCFISLALIEPQDCLSISVDAERSDATVNITKRILPYAMNYASTVCTQEQVAAIYKAHWEKMRKTSQ